MESKRYRQHSDARNELDKVVEELKRKEKADGGNKRESAHAMKNRTVERKSEHELIVTPNLQRTGPHRVRGMDQARALQAMIGAEVDGALSFVL